MYYCSICLFFNGRILTGKFGIIPKLALIFPFNLTEKEIEKSKYTQMKIQEIHLNREAKLEKAKARVSERLAEAQLIREINKVKQES